MPSPRPRRKRWRRSGTKRDILRAWRSQLQLLQILAERSAEIAAAQRVLDRGFEKAQFIAGVVARAIEPVRVDGTAAQQVAQGVGKLNFAARPRCNRLERVEDLGRQHVPA